MNPSRLLSPLLALALVAPGTTAAAAEDEVIVLVPVGSTLMQLESVAPAGWEEVAPGSYARNRSDTDLTSLTMQAAPLPVAQLWPTLLPRLGFDEVPEPIEVRSTDYFDWAIYETEITAPPVAIRFALADRDGRAHLVILQSTPDEHALLVEQVFDPALAALAPLTPDPTATAASPDVNAEEVTFPGGGEGVQLAGTLTLPAGAGSHPVVVLMNGSGAQDRDSSFRPVTELAPFAILADAFADAGIGTLRYDDRGVGGSVGDYASATVEDFAADGAAAVDYLTTRADVDQAQIGVLGHSEGGIYAASLAADHPAVSFAIGLATIALSGLDTVSSQQAAILRSMGTEEDYIERVVAFNRDAISQAAEGDMAAAEATLVEAYQFAWEGLSDEWQELIGDREAWVDRSVAAALPRLDTDYIRSFVEVHPGQDWSRVTVPVLHLFGGLDIQVIAEEQEPAMRAALEAAGNEDFEIVTLPDANHLFQRAEVGTLDEYSQLPPELHPDLLPTLLGWLRDHVTVAG